MATKDPDFKAFKAHVLNLFTERLVRRVQELKESIAQLQEDANDETKSSAGDKYETGRAMMQIEIEKLNHQLAAVIKNKTLIESINATAMCDSAVPGCVVKTSGGTFLIAYNGGEISVAETKVIAISHSSPLGQKLLHKTKDDIVELNGRTFRVEAVF